jgi:hypothetical protein
MDVISLLVCARWLEGEGFVKGLFYGSRISTNGTDQEKVVNLKED